MLFANRYQRSTDGLPSSPIWVGPADVGRHDALAADSRVDLVLQNNDTRSERTVPAARPDVRRC
jgi:hypothetical protein